MLVPFAAPTWRLPNRPPFVPDTYCSEPVTASGLSTGTSRNDWKVNVETSAFSSTLKSPAIVRASVNFARPFPEMAT